MKRAWRDRNYPTLLTSPPPPQILAAMDSDDERQGAMIILRSLSAPLKQIANNAGIEGAVVLAKTQVRMETRFFSG